MFFSPILGSWRFLLEGLGVTVALCVLVTLASTGFGLAVGLARLYGGPGTRAILGFYVDTMRSLPELAVIVLTFFAVPVLSGVSIPPFWAALLALSVQLSAYMSEIVRAGIGSIRPGQTRAGLAIGMSHSQIVRKILLPQAAVRMMPTYGSHLSVIIKDSAIASVIAVPDLMHRAQVVASQTYRPIEVFTTAMIAYFCMLYPVTRGIDALYRRLLLLGQS